MYMNKLYEKCKNELDRILQNHQDEDNINLLRNEILYQRIKFYFLDRFLNKKIYNKIAFGGGWLLYEWNRDVDEVQADERIQTFPRLNKTINDLRKCKAHNISTTRLINTLTLEIIWDIKSDGCRYESDR